MNRANSKLPDRVDAPSGRVRRFAVHGGLLLLDKSTNTLFAYNEVALRIWELIEGGRSEAEIATEVARQWGIAVSRAQDDMGAIVALWRAQGLLAGGDRPADVAATTGSAATTVSSAPPQEWICTIRGVAFALSIAAELAVPVRALFSHLETPGVAPRSRMSIVGLPPGELAFVEDGRERVRTEDPTLAIGALYVAILERLWPGVQWFALLHGAALARQGHAFALAGASGSGKSTLAAGLMADGFDYIADDLVALSSPGATLLPWPMPLGLKPGSLDVVASRYPDLAQADRYRTKGVEARLLVPPAGVWDAEPLKLRTLIFPRFTAGAAPQTRRLSSFEALERLLTDRVWLGDPITEERVALFLAWLDATPAHAISYGTLDDAVRLVESVIP